MISTEAIITSHHANDDKAGCQREIITNYELFVELVEGVFRRVVESKILGQIESEIMKIGRAGYNKQTQQGRNQ